MSDLQNNDWVNLGPTDDYPQGKIVSRTIGRNTVLIYHEDRDWYVFEPRCPHMSRSLENARIQNGSLECAWHNMVFDLRTGAVIEDSGFFDIPALTVYNIKVVRGEVFAALAGITPSAP